MDREGLVSLNVVARFNRVRALTQDIELIREVWVCVLCVRDVFSLGYAHVCVCVHVRV